jgi:hypothetical protein
VTADWSPVDGAASVSMGSRVMIAPRRHRLFQHVFLPSLSADLRQHRLSETTVHASTVEPVCHKLELVMAFSGVNVRLDLSEVDVRSNDLTRLTVGRWSLDLC